MEKIKNREQYYEDMGQVFKVLSSPVRLKLLNFISYAPRTVEDCAKKFNQSVQNISLHLITLTKANLLQVEQIKNFRFYSLSDSHQMGLVARIIASDERSLLSEEDISHENMVELKKKINEGEAVLIDLRSDEEVGYLPIEGTENFTDKMTKFRDYLLTLPQDKDFYFFCKGKLCERLFKAVEIGKVETLRVKGLTFSAQQLKEFGALMAQ